MTSANFEAVGELIRPTDLRHRGAAGAAYTVRAPCRLDMLREAIAVGMEVAGGSGSGVPGSRPTISAPAMDLWLEIERVVKHEATALDLSIHDPHDGQSPPWIGRLLRNAVLTAESAKRQAVADGLGAHARRWVRQIDHMLSGARTQWPVRDVPCVQCGELWVFDRGPDGDGAYRRPAVALMLDDDGTRHFVCVACGYVEPVPDWSDEVVYASETPPPPGPPPGRIRLSRLKGWRLADVSADAVVVSRPSRWGNPFTVAQAMADGWSGDERQAREAVVLAFGHWLAGGIDIEQKRRDRILAELDKLRGKSLACWCPPDEPCHADILLDLANQPTEPECGGGDEAD